VAVHVGEDDEDGGRPSPLLILFESPLLLRLEFEHVVFTLALGMAAQHMRSHIGTWGRMCVVGCAAASWRGLACCMCQQVASSSHAMVLQFRVRVPSTAWGKPGEAVS